MTSRVIPDATCGAASGSGAGHLWAGVRLLVEGELTATVLDELEGFGVRAEGSGLVLEGDLPDQTALWGVLRRLHAAGLAICAVERIEHPAPRRGAAGPRSDGRERTVRIEVDGGVTALLADLTGGVVRPGGHPMALEVRVVDDDDLIAVLDDIDTLGLTVRSVDARGVGREWVDARR